METRAAPTRGWRRRPAKMAPFLAAEESLGRKLVAGWPAERDQKPRLGHLEPLGVALSGRLGVQCGESAVKLPLSATLDAESGRVPNQASGCCASLVRRPTRRIEPQGCQCANKIKQPSSQRAHYYHHYYCYYYYYYHHLRGSIASSQPAATFFACARRRPSCRSRLAAPTSTSPSPVAAATKSILLLTLISLSLLVSGAFSGKFLLCERLQV